MCVVHVANLGKTPLLFWFLTFCFHLTTFLCFLDLLVFAPLFISSVLMKLVTLVSHICYFCLYFNPHHYNFQTDTTAPFRNMVLVRLQLFLCLYSLFVSLNHRLLFCNTVYCTPLLCGFRFTNVSRRLHFYCVAPRICVFKLLIRTKLSL